MAGSIIMSDAYIIKFPDSMWSGMVLMVRVKGDG
jgi:hypothetical protein